MGAGKYEGAVDMGMQSNAGEYNMGAVVQDDEHLLSRSIMYVDIEMISPDLRQFRRVFDGIDELAESIQQDGLLQPLLIKAVASGAGQWQIVSGERHWRAAQKAGLKKVPCNILEKTDKSDELAFIDNVQRASLSALEIYHAIREFTLRGMKHRAILVMLGRTSESYVSKAVRVADFAENAISANFTTFPELAQKVSNVTLNNLYEIALIADDDMTLAIEVLDKIVTDDLSARAAGEYISNIRERMNAKPEPVPVADTPAEPTVDVTASDADFPTDSPTESDVADVPEQNPDSDMTAVSEPDSGLESDSNTTAVDVTEEASPTEPEQNPDLVEGPSPEETEWAAEADTGILDDSTAILDVPAAPEEPDRDDGSTDALTQPTITPTTSATPVNASGEQWSYRTVKNLLDDAARLMTQIEKVQTVNIFVGDKAKNNKVVRDLIDDLLPRVKTLPGSLSQLRDKFSS